MAEPSGARRSTGRGRVARGVPAFGLFASLGLAAVPAVAEDPGPGVVELGRTVYAETCASCHGANLEGQPDWKRRLANGRMPAPPHDASGHTWHHSDQSLFVITREGVAAIVPGYESDMPAFEGVLNDAEIRAVIAYIKSRWPEEILKRQQRINFQAAQ